MQHRLSQLHFPSSKKTPQTPQFSLLCSIYQNIWMLPHAFNHHLTGANTVIIQRISLVHLLDLMIFAGVQKSQGLYLFSRWLKMDQLMSCYATLNLWDLFRWAWAGEHGTRTMRGVKTVPSFCSIRWLDLISLEVFSNLNDSMILSCQGVFVPLQIMYLMPGVNLDKCSSE